MNRAPGHGCPTVDTEQDGDTRHVIRFVPELALVPLVKRTRSHAKSISVCPILTVSLNYCFLSGKSLSSSLISSRLYFKATIKRLNLVLAFLIPPLNAENSVFGAANTRSTAV